MAKISETELILNRDGSLYHLNLKPGQVSDTIIAVGDPSRVYAVSRYFDDVDFEMNRREFITHTGKYKNKKITVMSTGIGSDNVEIFFTEVDALFNIDLKKRVEKPRKKKLKIIRIGTSGALQEDIPVGSHLISEYGIGLDALMNFYKLKQHNFELTISNKLKEIIDLDYQPYVVKGSEMLKKRIGKNMVVGNTVTCPGFYAPQGRKIRLELKKPKILEKLNYFHHENFWLTNFEMETAAYYALGRMMGHEVISVNAIIANRIKNKLSKNPAKVVDDLIKIVLDRL